MDQKLYDSGIETKLLQLRAPYYNAINPTAVHFVQENIIMTVNSLGHIVFLNEENNPLGEVDFPVDKDPSKYAHTAQYGEVKCGVENNCIIVYLPVYYWTDSYPHCDGESDRWSRYVSRWFRVIFDCSSRQITIIDKEDAEDGLV